jgi:signal transduction histidine kinase
MIANNGCVILVMLALALIILSFQLWRNSLLQYKLRISKSRTDKEVFSFVSAIVERDRSRISAELHDELGSLLSIISMDLELVMSETSSLTPDAENRLIEIKRNLNAVIDSIRTNIWNLSTELFDQVDLGFFLRELCNKLDRHKGTHVTFVQSGIPFPLRENYKLHLFRITQELLTNSMKHSGAWNISLHIDWQHDQSLSITLEDDGKGYEEGKDRDGIGIMNIARRASFIDAVISRDRLEKGCRTTVSAKISSL